MKFFVTQIAGRVVIPVYFITLALVSLVRPRAGAMMIKALRDARDRI